MLSRKMQGAAALVVILAILGCASAQEYNRAVATPVAFTNRSGFNYVLYGSTRSANASQVWAAAQAACRAISGSLTSAVDDNEGNLLNTLFTYYQVNASAVAVGNASLCTWVGYTNIFNVNGSFVDGASTSYMRNQTIVNPWNPRVRNNEVANCTAICVDPQGRTVPVNRDCDFEAQSFICKTTAAPTGGVALPAPPPIYAPVYPPPPAYGSPSPVSSPRPSPSPSPPPYGSYPPSYPPPPPPASRFSKCAEYGRNRYCAIAGVITLYAFADAQYYCNNYGAGNLASITSTAELTFILAQFAPNSTVPAFWTAGIKSGFYPPYNLNGDNATWLQSVAGSIAAPSTAYVNVMGGRGYCASGYGCGVALTYNAQGTAAGLQYVDTSYMAAVLCKQDLGPAPPVPIPPTPSPGAIPTTTRNPGDTWVAVPLQVTLSMTSSGCNAISANRAAFDYQFSDTTTNTWNTNNPTLTIRTGDVTVGNVNARCSRRLRNLLHARNLLQTAPSATVTATMNMPNGASASDISSRMAAFRLAANNAYASGTFAGMFGVTSADTTTGTPVQQTRTAEEDDDNKALALGLGIGLGLGIPILLAAIFATWYALKRRHAQTVGQTPAPPA